MTIVFSWMVAMAAFIATAPAHALKFSCADAAGCSVGGGVLRLDLAGENRAQVRELAQGVEPERRPQRQEERGDQDAEPVVLVLVERERTAGRHPQRRLREVPLQGLE